MKNNYARWAQQRVTEYLLTHPTKPEELSSLTKPASEKDPSFDWWKKIGDRAQGLDALSFIGKGRSRFLEYY